MNQEDVERYLQDISFRELMCEIERRHLEVVNDNLESENDVNAFIEKELSNEKEKREFSDKRYFSILEEKNKYVEEIRHLQHSLNEALKRENNLKENHLKHFDIQHELSSRIMTLKMENNSMLATIDNLRQHKEELEEKIQHKNIQTKKLTDVLKRQRETIENFIRNGGLDIDA